MVPSRFLIPSAAPGERGPSWKVPTRGARARRFTTVRVQTEVCRFCGLQAGAAETAIGRKYEQDTQIVRTPRVGTEFRRFCGAADRQPMRYTRTPTALRVSATFKPRRLRSRPEIAPRTEPPRKSRRLQLSRRWSHEQTRRVFPGGSRAGREAGSGTPVRVRIAVGADRVGCGQDRLHGRDAARLMKRLGLRGVIRGKPVRTTVSDAKLPCPLDHVQRRFASESDFLARLIPRRRWIGPALIHRLPAGRHQDRHRPCRAATGAVGRGRDPQLAAARDGE